ncbi:Bax inhibitor-1/YccA family protein [Segetibacter sp. 3557_3]|uniref:Bax inhibitor-1/YccA family protein n=1 Tax=Segetibacter sp. 3557_3 TaxID=2547429 RepID=UPI001058AF96|nr:Bax inhibitor-1/YccA family protein [Segetibacter sp. 3557_3]TDH20851.1 Bax inhibitor-1/YccA family protein [Segetibacter sp. 3557_3]
MSLLKSGNPTLTEKIFDTSLADRGEGVMTARGSLNKFGFLFLMVIAGAGFTWHLFDQGKMQLMYPLMLTGVFGGFILALVITFKPKWAGYLAPLYGLLEGLFIGALSAIVNNLFAANYPGIVMQAVGLTMGVAVAMFLLYHFRVIRATEKFKSMIITATVGIAIFYGITMLLRLFGVEMDFMMLGNGSLLGIGISLFVVAIAALNLILDFDRIEQGAAQGAPKYMEWYCAFGLLVTIVWLYIEMLKLLSRFSSRD